MKRERFSSGGPWEQIVGYSRAVRIGDRVLVSGTTATDIKGDVVGEGDAYLQTSQAIRNIEKALLQAGATLDDVVRTRTYVTDIGQWEAIAKAHRECFAQAMPCSTMVEVSRLIRPEMLVEIEVEAVVQTGGID